MEGQSDLILLSAALSQVRDTHVSCHKHTHTQTHTHTHTHTHTNNHNHTHTHTHTHTHKHAHTQTNTFAVPQKRNLERLLSVLILNETVFCIWVTVTQ